MTNQQEKIENWAAEEVIDEMMVNDFKKVDDCPHYHAYAELFKRWHKSFSENKWAFHINNLLEEYI